MKEQPFIDPFENVENLATLDGAKHAVNVLKEQFERGHGKSGFQLAFIFDPCNTVVPDEIKHHLGVSEERSAEYFTLAFEILLSEAEAGNSESMYLVSQYYQTGTPPVAEDVEKSMYWKNKAIQAGYKHVGQI
jgi:TPR repeat protein